MMQLQVFSKHLRVLLRYLKNFSSILADFIPGYSMFTDGHIYLFEILTDRPFIRLFYPLEQIFRMFMQMGLVKNRQELFNFFIKKI